MTKNPIAVRDDNVPVGEGQTFFQALRALGLAHFEMGVNFEGGVWTVAQNGAPCNVADDAGVADLKARLQEEGASVAALLLHTDFSGDQADKHAAFTVRAAHVAQQLGVSAIRLDPLTSKSELSREQICDNVARHIKEILAQTKNTGVEFGLENHGVVGNDPRFLDDVFAAVGDDRLGMTLDTANFYWSGMPLSEVYATLEHFAPRAKHTHFKSIAYPENVRETRREPDSGYAQYCMPLDKGDFDLVRVIRILRDAGYAGSLCIEDESLPRVAQDEKADVLRGEIAALQAAQQSA